MTRVSDREWIVRGVAGEPIRFALVAAGESAADGPLPSRAERVGKDDPLAALLYALRDGAPLGHDEAHAAAALLDVYEALTGDDVMPRYRLYGDLAPDPASLPRDLDARLADALYCAVERGALRVERIAPAPWPFPEEPDVAPPRSAEPAVEERATFIDLRLVDQGGAPVPRAAYRLTLPDGSERSGVLDGQGRAHVGGIWPPGPCRLVFPEIDANDFA